MFQGFTSTSVGEDRTKQIKEAFEKLKVMDVLVGIPQKNNSRDDPKEPITNAELLFVHTKGSPLRRIPARPVIEPAIENDQEVISDMLKEVIIYVLDGNYEEAYKALEMAGLEGQNAAQDWFDNPSNGWPPNSPRTAEIKKAKGSTDPRPLIDTNEMRKAITYVVRKEGEANA